MPTLTLDGSQVWRDYETDEVPLSGNHNPEKADARRWCREMEDYMDDVLAAVAGESEVLGNVRGPTDPVTDGNLALWDGTEGRNLKEGGAPFLGAYAALTGKPPFTALIFAAAPIGGESDGDAYIVTTGTGDFTGWDKSVAVREDGEWVEHPAREGMLIWVSGLSTFYLYRNGAWQIGAPPTLDDFTNPLELYVATTGNDTTGDGSIGAPFLTGFKAAIVGQFSQRPYVTIRFAAGAYSETMSLIAGLSTVGNQFFDLIGDEETPSNVSGINFFLDGSPGCEVSLFGFETSSIQAFGGLKVYPTNMRYVGSGEHLSVDERATIVVTGNEEIDGNFNRHLFATDSARILYFPDELTLIETPTIGAEFASAYFGGKIISDFPSTVGTAEGKRAFASMGGLISVLDEPFPGDEAGDTATGGQYDGS